MDISTDNYGSKKSHRPDPFLAFKRSIQDLIRKLKMPIGELELSVRSANCLEAANIKTIGELIQKTEGQMLKYKNFGKKSLNEINAILTGMNLHLGMNIEDSSLNKGAVPAAPKEA